MADPRDNGSIVTGFWMAIFLVIWSIVVFWLGYKVRDDGNIWRFPFTHQPTRQEMRDQLYPSPGIQP
ncbi:MAG: hypothetical protein KME45_03225 [Stenomitos rutilans HA7619-LM2]|nr:hypothetical protein [Stenomitos rutilans HA7619-LM2]MBW4469397.1 hypothetical protein [Stenomitos rutilans HA7619-LM2]